MVAYFSEKEVKHEIWNCATFNSPGLDGVNFGFLKYFWNDVKEKLYMVLVRVSYKWKACKGVKLYAHCCDSKG